MAALATPVTVAPDGDGELHGVGPDAAGGADDEHGLTRRTWAASTARSAVRPETGMAAACAKVRIVGLWASLSSRADGVLSEGAARDAEDLVADGEARDVRADRDDGAGDVSTGDAVLRPAEADGGAHQVGLALSSGARRPG